MTNITITESEQNENNLYYVQTAISEILTQTGCSVKNVSGEKRAILTVDCPEEYVDIVRLELFDKVAEVIVVKYKNDFFKRNVSINGLSSVEKEILMASLIAADLEEDKRYTFERIKSCKELAIDGVYNFRLKALKKKWKDITEYIPECFLNSQLKDFISYLLENKKKRVYVEGGRVYDSHYRRLQRCNLLDGETAILTREILLSNCGEVRLSGKISKEDEYYLKEFYNDKIIFQKEFYN